MAVLALSASLLASEAVPEAVVDAVLQVESGGRNVSGDGGKARGPFQFHEEAWSDCSAVRRKAGLSVYRYSSASDPKKAREYARTWLTVLSLRLTKDIGRKPFPGEVWLAYNLGYAGFAEYRFQWASVPEAKFTKARRVNSLSFGRL